MSNLADNTQQLQEALETAQSLPKFSLPTLTVTGVDADGVTHTWTIYGKAN